MEEIREAMGTTITPETPAEWWEGTSYEDAKAIIRSNMDNVARNSVAIGYYLRSIRDKQQYREGGYQSFEDFVRAEYSMSYSAASRLIGLCERFSRGGNSPVLADSYQGYSKSLLVEMLPMSDAQLEQVQPGMTVADVREIKREAREDAVSEPDPEPPAEEPEVVFQLAGAEETSRQDVVERLEAVMPAPVFEEDEPHDGVWFAKYILAHYSLIEWAPEIFANMTRPDNRLAKMLQEEVAPHGYSGFSDSEIDIQFLEYFKGVDCAVGKEKHHWTYIQLIKDLRAALEERGSAGQEEPADYVHDQDGACTVLSDPDVAQPCVDGPYLAEEPVATSQIPACIMGYAESGVCGSAAYCAQPYRCCLQCDVACNGRCGWIPSENAETEPEIATSQRQNIWSGMLHDMPLFSRQSVRDYIADAEAELKEYLECEGLPDTTLLRKQMFVAGLRLLLQAVEEREVQ